MKKQICIIILLTTCRICDAQNLVPNGDFEQYIACPTSDGQLDSCLYWFDPIAITPGSDYYNACAPWSIVSVPHHILGYQKAHSGDAYSGLFLWQPGGNYREYIEIPTLSPLIGGACYYFEMFVNLINSSNYTTNEISVYFSNVIIDNINSFHPLPYNPQINNPIANTFDTLNWTVVTGNYTALGGENYLIIGNFKNDANTDTIQIQTGNYNYAYVLIDDVSLSLCATGTNEINEHSATYIYPNPFTDKINITVKRNNSAELILYDVAGRKTVHKSFLNSTSINTERLAKGVYLYEVRDKNGVIKKGKVVKD